MTIFLTIIHIMVSLFLIAVVLLQSGKGAEMGAAFGGSSQTLFGSRGAATFLSKMTTISAIVFMVTSLLLAVVTTKGTSVVQKVPVTQGQKTGSPVSGQMPLTPQQIPQTQQQQSPPQTQQQKIPAIPVPQPVQKQPASQAVPQPVPQQQSPGK
jgi:preprotein translocase subunit SecG